MADVGFLYVLANSAMPGLVKVGKTTRSPAERASELSATTGLPTPFIVVYEQLFQDCTEAEGFVHTFLASKGFRVSESREFFSAPVNDVIRAIALAPGALEANVGGGAHGLADATLHAAANVSPWCAVFEEAEKNANGWGGYIQDLPEAVRLYKKSIKLGSIEACGRMGDAHANGSGCRKDMEQALGYYRQGSKKGSLYCYWRLGEIFLEMGESRENVDKCFSLFLSNFATIKEPNDGLLTAEEIDRVFLGCIDIVIKSMINRSYKFPKVLLEFMADLGENIKGKAEGLCQIALDGGWEEAIPIYRKIPGCVDELISMAR